MSWIFGGHPGQSHRVLRLRLWRMACLSSGLPIRAPGRWRRQRCIADVPSMYLSSYRRTGTRCLGSTKPTGGMCASWRTSCLVSADSTTLHRSNLHTKSLSLASVNTQVCPSSLAAASLGLYAVFIAVSTLQLLRSLEESLDSLASAELRVFLQSAIVRLVPSR